LAILPVHRTVLSAGFGEADRDLLGCVPVVGNLNTGKNRKTNDLPVHP
jgi:hypothetical protein